MIKVSIIIPIYNVEKYLAECLESVVSQTLREIEIICINDCSTDQSIEILQQYAKHDMRITIINNNENKGQSFARNCGIKKASGKYIYFLDSDDKVVEQAMEELYSLCEESMLDGALFDCEIIFENDKLRKQFTGYKAQRKNDYNTIYSGKELFIRLIGNKEWMASPPRQFWNRDYLMRNHLNFYEGIIHEDELFSFLAIINAKKLICCKDMYFIRRFRENSTMTTPMIKRKFEGLFIVYCKILEFWQMNSLDERINGAIEEHTLILYRRLKVIFENIPNDENINLLIGSDIVTKQMLKLFIAEMNKNNLYSKIDSCKMNEIKKYNNVFIYGAGAIGKEVLSIVGRDQEICIKGFVVSNREGNPKNIMGIPVKCAENLIGYKDTSIILLAVSNCYHSEIITKLHSLNFKNIMLMC